MASCSTPLGLASETFCYPELCSGLFTVNPFRVIQFKCQIGINECYDERLVHLLSTKGSYPQKNNSSPRNPFGTLSIYIFEGAHTHVSLMDEAGIIAGCKNNNRRSQKALFEIYSKGMLLLCRRYVKDAHDAEEVLLTGFSKFFATIERFEYAGDKSVGGWLKKIMVNECFMHLRRSKGIVVVSEELAAEATIDDAVLEKMSANAILRLIDALPDGYRVVFNLYVIEGYNHREIAELLGITEGGSKSQLSRAKIFLQNMLQQKDIVYER